MKIINRLSFLLLISFSVFLVTVSAQTDCAEQDYECKANVSAKLIQANPNNTEAYYELGFSLRQLGKLPQAIENLSKYIELKPEKADYLADGYIQRGVAYLNSQKEDLALADFNSAIAVYPASGSAYINRGLVYYHKNDYEKALADFNKAIQLDPDNPESFYNRGLVYIEKSQFAESIADLDKYISMATSNKEYLADGYFDRGRAYFLKGDAEAGIKDINMAIDTAPSVRFYKLRAAIYREQGKTSLAEEDERKAANLQQ